MKVTAIFDIGKTNKKCFLFNEKYQEVFKEYRQIEESTDDDNFPTDNLPEIAHWIKNTLNSLLKNKKYKLKAINFSTYGASFVHINKHGKVVAPLYNYLKPFPEEILQSFYNKYGDKLTIASQTASPASGMLNSGFQLYWLKYCKPEIFKQIKYSLHFPQYLSYLFTGIPISDYSSIGCHTGLWDYKKGDYHDWVYAEDIDKILPAIVSAKTSINRNYNGHILKIGVGIHDSSAALLPYLKADKKPFLLISTGTWSIALNPFDEEILTKEDLKNDCLNYMRINGQAIKAARLFLGSEYQLQVEKLNAFFQKESNYHRHIQFDQEIFSKLQKDPHHKFHFERLHLKRQQPEKNQLESFSNFTEAYHQLMIELMNFQVLSAKMAIGSTEIKKIYVDGGFADNDIYVKLLGCHFSTYKLRTTQSPLGSALGAAMAISDKVLSSKFLRKQYALKKHKPLSF